MTIPDDVLARHKRCLELFILRARRVDTHSLAIDRDELHRLATGNFEVEADPETGQATLRRSFPAEEVVESAAARVRPFILDRDSIFHGKVTAALGAFAAGNDLAFAEVAKAKTWWKAIDPRSEEVRGYAIQRVTLNGEEEYVSDNVLAFAWIYGDTIHADEASIARAVPFDVDERFQAAVPLVAGIMIRVIATLRIIEEFHKANLVELPPEIFTVPVVATTRELVKEAIIRVAPAGTLPPRSGEEWGPEWKRFMPAAAAPRVDTSRAE